MFSGQKQQWKAAGSPQFQATAEGDNQIVEVDEPETTDTDDGNDSAADRDALWDAFHKLEAKVTVLENENSFLKSRMGYYEKLMGKVMAAQGSFLETANYKLHQFHAFTQTCKNYLESIRKYIPVADWPAPGSYQVTDIPDNHLKQTATIFAPQVYLPSLFSQTRMGALQSHLASQSPYPPMDTPIPYPQ